MMTEKQAALLIIVAAILRQQKIGQSTYLGQQLHEAITAVVKELDQLGIPPPTVERDEY